jgi:phospholipid transport system substrate-binding protein
MIRDTRMIRTLSPLTDRLDRRHLLLALLATGLLPLGWHVTRAAPSVDDARTLIEKVSAEVLAVLSDQALSDRQKFDALVKLLEGPIDLDLVARLILGRHWRTADETQRQEYLGLFRDYALANLASKLHLYRGQSFEVTGARVVSDQDALVSSRILSSGEPPLQVDWRLRERDGAAPVTIDLIVEGVSLIVTLRSEFGAVIERQGFAGLLVELRQRITQTRQEA